MYNNKIEYRFTQISFYSKKKVSCFIRGVSCFIRGVSCFIRGVSCFIRGVSCFIRGVSCFIRGVSCFIRGVSCFIRGVSCFIRCILSCFIRCNPVFQSWSSRRERVNLHTLFKMNNVPELLDFSSLSESWVKKQLEGDFCNTDDWPDDWTFPKSLLGLETPLLEVSAFIIRK